MNMLKRSFAMLLALCMLVSAVPVNAIAAEATDLTEPIVLETDAPEVTEAPIESETPTESEVPTESEIPTEGETIGEEETPTEGVTVPEEETPTEGVTIPEEEAPTEGVTVPEEETVPEETEEFFEIGWVSEEEISGVTMGENPGTGTTNSEPFPQGTGGSNSFRIPALVTLSNGNLVAAADARWNSTLDNGGIDTILSISSNGGDTWEWSFPNYLGDNGNFYNNASTCFIDPALAVTGNTIYMLVDLYPYGVAITGTAQQTASTAVGFNSAGKLLLSGDNHSTYGYYLDGTTIRDSSGNAVSGYTVDEYFNITKAADNTTTNLFFEDSPYKVVRTGYLYLTKSTNGGETWSAPTLIPNVKTTSEYSCLVGPGRGLVTSKGTIVFPVYKYAGSTNSQVMSFLYSTDSGATWTRSANCGVSWSSEAAVVELSDGTLRFFYRNGNALLSYVDYSFTTGWGSEVRTAVPTNSNTQLSAITYSKTIGGKQVILVSCPTGANSNGSTDNSGSARVNGKIFAFTVEADKTLNKVGSVDVTSDGAQFMYSCLTERKDGAVSILYEDQESNWGTGDNSYYTMDFKAYSESELETALGVTFDEDANTGDSGEEITNKVNVSLKVGETVNETIAGITLTGSNTDTSVATVTWVGTDAVSATGTLLSDNSEIGLADCLFTFTKDADGYYVVKNGNYYLNQTCSSSARIPCVTTPGKVAVVDGYFDEMFQLKSQIVEGSNYTTATPSLHFHTELSTPYWNRCGNDVSIKCHEYLYRIANAGETSSAEIPGYVRVKEPADIVSGEQYLIAQTNGTNYYVLYPQSSDYSSIVKVNADSTVTAASTTVTITGNTVGATSVTVGTTTYNITVVPENITNVVDVELEVGESMTYTDSTGNYEGNSNNVAPNAAVAGMKVEGTTIAGNTEEVLTLANSITGGSQYYLSDGKGNFLSLDGTSLTNKTDIAEATLWTVTASGIGYTIKSGNTYLRGSSSLTTSTNSDYATAFQYDAGDGFDRYGFGTASIICNNGTWSIGRLSNDNSAKAYTLTKQTTAPVESTRITFTGIAAGEATAVVGTTQYNITVTPYVIDDEINASGSNTWTVNAELQRQRYNSLTGLSKDLYTDESWADYEAARKAAYAKLAAVNGATYTSEADATAALNELIDAVDALETAKNELVSAKTISVRYQLNSSTIDTREYKVAADATTLTLPATIVVNNVAYTVDETELTLGVDTTVNVPVSKVGALGGGFVASVDIGSNVFEGMTQVCDLVDDDGTARKITEMTLTTGVSYDLNLATDTTGYTVEWTTGDDKVATVYENGLVTAVGEGTTTVVATVKDADGNVVEVNSIPVTVFPSAATDRPTAIYIENIDNTTVYCVVNADTENRAFEVIEGELIYGKFDTPVSDGTATTAFTFFGNPDEAHALVAMTSTNSFGDYYLLHDDNGDMGVGTEYYILPDGTTGAGYWQAIGLTDNAHDNKADWTLIRAMVQWAIDNGCDGGMGFTRRLKEGDIGSNLTFISDPMPKIEKTIDGVLPTSRKQADYRDYTEGMVAAVGELVYFKITVTLERPTVWKENSTTIGAINYTNAILSDTVLKGAYLYTKELDEADGKYDGEISTGNRVQTEDISAKLNAAWEADETVRTLDFYLVYEIQESDIPKFWIDNIANLSYNYQSHYSTGSQAGAADAEARISVVGTSIDDVVIDFGQSFTYTGLTNIHLKGVYVNGQNDSGVVDEDGNPITKCKATAKYGTVEVTRKQKGTEVDDKGYPVYEYTVVYTPTTILQGVDTVLMYGVGDQNQEKIINGFLVYPATTVYYEEGFMLNSESTWNGDDAQRATGEQTFELLGESQYDDHGMLTHKITNQKYAYGYDPLYEKAAYDYGDSYASAATSGQKTTFTFTGTGFDLYANCTTETGRVSVQVKDTAGKLVKLYTVDTVVQVGDTPATNDGTELKEEFHLPIVSVDGLDHGTYTVSLVKIAESVKNVKIDGVRIHNTVKDSSVFNIDLEDNPVFQELRDLVLTAVDVYKTASEDYGDDWMTTAEIGPLAEQVYGSIVTGDEEVSAVVTSVANIYGEGATAQDLLDNGPKNELFLYPGQTLTFNVETKREMQIGLKAPRAATAFKLSYNDGTNTVYVVKDLEEKTFTTTTTETSVDLNTSVDMFYALGNPTGTSTEYTVSVTNTGNDILSVTDLKICDDPNAAFVPLTVDDIEYILTQAGVGVQEPAPEEPIVPEEPEVPVIEYADAVLKINLVDYTGKQLAAAELTANGIKGEENAFAGAAVLRMAERNLPKGYALVSKQADAVKVAYGEETTVSVQIGKVATVKVTFVNLLGRKVGTATITKVQTDAAPCRITAAEIRSLAPVGRLVIRLTSVTAAFGSTTNVIVPVV